MINVCLAGTDGLNRDLIMIYDISNYTAGDCRLFSKQISDFQITRLRYVDSRQPNLLVSCGRENICFWHLKNKFLTLVPLELNEHAQNNCFNDVDVLAQKVIVRRS